MKKSGIVLLGAICLSLLGCGNQSKKDAQAKLFYAYSTENLMSDWDYFDKENEDNIDYLDRDYKLRFNGMKNEDIAMQLMIHANEYIDKFTFKLPELVSETGEKLETSSFTVAAEWYQDVSVSKEKDAYTGLYPDALIPLSNYEFRRMNNIQKDRNQGLWISLRAKEDAKAGKYTGEGTLTLDGKDYSIPFEVNIYDAVMPNENHLQTCFLIWYEQISIGEGKNYSPDLEKAYYDFAVSKRISPDYLPTSYTSSVNRFVEAYVEEVANNPMVSCYRMPGGTGSNFNKNSAKTYLNALIDKNIALRQAGDTTTDLFKKLIFYVDDEPSPQNYELVKGHDKDIFDLKKELAPRLSAYPDLQDSLLHIKNTVTVEYNDTLVATNETGGVQTWCPQVQNFQTATNRENYKARQSSTDRDYGENVWWYVCESPNNPYPNYHLDGQLLYTRTLKFMQYAYGIEGEIHWNICYYSKYASGFTTGRDIWYDPLTWEKCNGDGAMVYPGKEFGINGPITTLRMESILNANEDYEAQLLVDKKVQEYNSNNGTSYDTATLLKGFYSRLFKDMKTICTNNEFEEIHTEFLSLVQDLYTDLDKGMSKLIK